MLQFNHFLKHFKLYFFFIVLAYIVKSQVVIDNILIFGFLTEFLQQLCYFFLVFLTACKFINVDLIYASLVVLFILIGYVSLKYALSFFSIIECELLILIVIA